MKELLVLDELGALAAGDLSAKVLILKQIQEMKTHGIPEFTNCKERIGERSD